MGSQDIIAEVHQDPKLQKIIDDLKQGIPTKAGFAYKNGVLLYEDRLVIAENSSWIPTMLKEFHSTP